MAGPVPVDTAEPVHGVGRQVADHVTVCGPGGLVDALQGELPSPDDPGIYPVHLQVLADRGDRLGEDLLAAQVLTDADRGLAHASLQPGPVGPRLPHPVGLV